MFEREEIESDGLEQAGLEPERYELRSGPAYRFDVNRRGFFQVVGGGLIVAFALEAQESGGGRRGGGRPAAPVAIGSWLHIDEAGVVTVYTGKAEVGQNARTSLTQVVSEELRAPLASIRFVMGDTDLTPYDQGTFGSMTTPQMGPQIRRASAAAREVLIDLAAGQWKADRGALQVADGKVTDGSRSLSFGELTKGQKLLKTIGPQVATVPAAEWKVQGQSIHKVNGREVVSGKLQHTTDIQRPGMVFGRVLRPAAFEAKLGSADLSKAKAMPGVTAVQDGDFVGVTAPDSLTASRALEAINAEWKTAPQPSNKELFGLLKSTSGPRTGSVLETLASADHKLESTYTVAYIAHAPLEPRAAVAEWTDGKLTVWTGTQRPFGVRSELATAFGIPEERVRVLVPDTGSGYGGKHTGEAAVEAARLAKAAGKPVKLVWTREEEFTWAYFRPAGVIEVQSGVRNDGTIVAWDFHNYNSGGSGLRGRYDIPGQRNEFHNSKSPLRQGSYRGLAATANHFAREVHIDELAHAVKMDPLEFRLKNLKDARQRDVLQAAAEKFGWGRTKPRPGHGFGIAGGFEKNAYVANCAEVAVDRASGVVKIVRVTTSFDCGPAINPDQLRNQIEGSIVMGIGGALFEAIEFENGKILNGRFSRYRLPRFSDVPVLETVIVDRKDIPPAGAGETPIIALAPAVSGAIFQATGVRLRSLPMVPNGLKV